ncbi:MAG: hypothetical protein RLZZ225_730 [Pseudomonadota bacterium]
MFVYKIYNSGKIWCYFNLFNEFKNFFIKNKRQIVAVKPSRAI